MNEILQIVAGAGGGGLLVVVMYTRVLAARLDDIKAALETLVKKVDKLDESVTDHEVRIRVIEHVKED